MKRIAIEGENAKYLFGLPWFKQNDEKTHRLPLWAKQQLPADLWDVSQDPAGARIRFATSTSCLAIRCVAENAVERGSNIKAHVNGIDLYADGKFWLNVIPQANGPFEAFYFRGIKPVKRVYELYLPLNCAINNIQLIVDANAVLEEAPPYSRSLPVVLYGTSITHGFWGSRPGMAFSAQFSRMANTDIVSYGFSGTGRGEPAAAQVVAKTKASCYVLDFGQNNETLEEMEHYYKPFCQQVRLQNPNTPILLTLPIFYCYESWDEEGRARQNAKRDIVKKAYNQLAPADKNLHLLDWNAQTQLESAEGQSDGAHPNDLGQRWMAEALHKAITSIWQTK